MRKDESPKIQAYFEIWSGIATNGYPGLAAREKSDGTGRLTANGRVRQVRKAVWIDIKRDWDRKSDSEIQQMIKEELNSSDWQQYEVIKLSEVLKRFKVDEKSDQCSKRSNNTNRGNWPPNQVDVNISTLRQQKREQRLSYGKKIYLYSLLKIKRRIKDNWCKDLSLVRVRFQIFKERLAEKQLHGLHRKD